MTISLVRLAKRGADKIIAKTNHFGIGTKFQTQLSTRETYLYIGLVGGDADYQIQLSSDEARELGERLIEAAKRS